MDRARNMHPKDDLSSSLLVWNIVLSSCPIINFPELNTQVEFLAKLNFEIKLGRLSLSSNLQEDATEHVDGVLKEVKPAYIVNFFPLHPKTTFILFQGQVEIWLGMLSDLYWNFPPELLMGNFNTCKPFCFRIAVLFVGYWRMQDEKLRIKKLHLEDCAWCHHQTSILDY